MKAANPYRPPDDALTIAMGPEHPRSHWRWALAGFALGAVLPVCLGIYRLHQFNVYVASLGPNQGVCGMGAIGAMAMIFVVGPFFGLTGAVIGRIASGFR